MDDPVHLVDPTAPKPYRNGVRMRRTLCGMSVPGKDPVWWYTNNPRRLEEATCPACCAAMTERAIQDDVIIPF